MRKNILVLFVAVFLAGCSCPQADCNCPQPVCESKAASADANDTDKGAQMMV